MKLADLVKCAGDKSRFQSLDDYVDFARRFLDFLAGDGVQARIVARNEPNYLFIQFKRDGNFNVTRPINSELLIEAKDSICLNGLERVIALARDAKRRTEKDRVFLRRTIYTLQQCIGAALDALPSGKSNTARKLNGDLFERLIRILVNHAGFACESGTVSVPVMADGTEQFRMSYQHDLVVKQGEVVRLIGSVKTSSKDRLDKIFVDKFLYSKITGTCVPHVAVFLNDVQRKATPKPNQFGVSATFLPGHFKGFTIKLNPLDGVYYCDLRPNMREDPWLASRIRTIDRFFCDDLPRFVP
ncbi:MAG: hypothetical protein IT434_07755 [Phycisphaerales bacterium]|nr:hypothetical protein [Phycisphaerales bacterium]